MPIRPTGTSTSTARPSCSRTTSRSGPSRSRGSGAPSRTAASSSARGTSCRTSFSSAAKSLVRNLVLGHRISRQFGTPMPVGYLPDLFGHVGQMPQIWRQFGLDNTILWRGFGGPDAEYWWEAPDGSRVLMMHLPPEGYCNATRIVFDPDQVMARAADEGRLRARAHPHRPGAADERRRSRRAARGDPDARRQAVVDRRPARDPFDAAGLRRRGQERRRTGPPGARDRRRRAAHRHRLREPPAGRALGARVSEAAERAAYRRCSSRTPSRSRCSRRSSARAIRPASCGMRGRRCCRTIRTTASAAAASTRCTKRT